MKLTITHQEHYSRGQLLLRTFFGWIYIAIPHYFVLMFVSIATGIFYLQAVIQGIFSILKWDTSNGA